MLRSLATSPLAALKFHYFLHGFGLAPIVAYLSVILRQLGVPGSNIAFLFSVKKILLQCLATPLGALMDKFPERKILLYRLTLIGTMVGFYCLLHLPPVKYPDAHSISVQCSGGERTAVTRDKADPCLVAKLNQFYARDIPCAWRCDGGADFAAFVNGADADADDAGRLVIPVSSAEGRKCKEDLSCSANCVGDQLDRVLNHPTPGQTRSVWGNVHFWLVFFCFVGGGVCSSASQYFQDALCQQMVTASAGSTAAEQQDYGKQRLWASVGWGLCSVLVGHMMDVESRDKLLFDYTGTSAAIFVVFMSVDVFVVGFWKIPASAQVRPKGSVWSELSTFIWKKDVLKFLFFCAIVGICLSSLSFAFIVLEDLMVTSSCSSRQTIKLLQGVALAFNCLTEVPTFVYSGRLIRRFGPVPLMHLVLLLWGVRLLWYSQMTQPWHILPVELLGGATQALAYSVMTTAANRAAPDGAKVTMVSLAYAVMDMCGFCLGGNVAGHVYDYHGGAAMYGGFCIFVFSALIFNVWLWRGSNNISSNGDDAVEKRKLIT